MARIQRLVMKITVKRAANTKTKKKKKQITYMKKKTKKLTGSWLYPENDS